MKRFTTFMVMLTCFIVGTWAQDVATTATPLESLQSGYYALVMKTADSRTDNTNGHFVYFGSDDLGIHYDETSATTHNLRGKTLNNDDYKYVFFVENNGGKISIKAYGTKYYWPAIPAPKENEAECNPTNQITFKVNTSAANYDYKANGEWYYLTMPATKKVMHSLFVTWWTTSNVTAQVNVNNDSHKIGYWESGDNNKCQFQFFAINDMPEPGEIATLTYNYIFNGSVRKTQGIGNARIGRAYPDVDLTDLPDYLIARKPEGNVTGDATIEIELKENLPFQTSTDASPVYYYFENVKGTRLYANGSSLAFRENNQTTEINDVRKDLWYVTGNVFDGFQFHNVFANNIVYNAAEMSHVTSLSFSYDDDYKCPNWDLFANGDNFSLCAPAGTEYYEFGFWSAHYLTKDNKKNYSWSLDDDNNGIGFNIFDATDDAFAFRLVEPTFTFPMYAVGSNTYNSFAAPFDVVLADAGSNVKMYKGSVNEDGKELVLSQVDGVPANEGVVLIGEGSNESSVTLKAVAGVATLENNDLIGTTETVSELSDKLIFGVSDQTGEVGFFSANSSVASLAANHAYLSKPSTSIFMLSMRIDGQTTAIGSISNDRKAESSAAIYDLAGRKVSKTVKGQFYIQNGRKFIAQ